MTDPIARKTEMTRLYLTAAPFALIAGVAQAGETIRYEDAPAWVQPLAVDLADRPATAAIVAFDQQARIEAGELWTYQETVLALDTPEALTQFGTLSAAWSPDKGDLHIHKAELVRGEEVIDLLGGGAQFDVLRREQQLEARMLDGMLTATMPVNGAQLGDLVRLAYSITLRDQAMGEEVQFTTGLPAKPFPLYKGQVRVSWPQAMEVSQLNTSDNNVAELTVQDGYKVWEHVLPIAEVKPKPNDAPMRFLVPPLLQIGTYANWDAVLRTMAVHYDTRDAIVPGSTLAGEIAAIAGASDDPRVRMAAALRLVQDQVSYLMYGLDGGNYLPQTVTETWEKRFGDCKAKSLLLLAALRELGITSEAVLVNTSIGDALPSLAPIPGNFDHVIVRAELDGKSYWLDGTMLGTRIDTIDDVPRFHYALPLREAGTGLMPLENRPQSVPDQVARITFDQRAGIRVPTLFDVEIEMRGGLGAQWQALAEQAEEELREQAITSTVSDLVGAGALTTHDVSYDIETGTALITASGLLTSPWSADRRRFQLTAPGQAARNVAFNADRARAAWRDIPLRLNGPLYFTSEFSMLLPDHAGTQFSIDGAEQIAQIVGGVQLSSASNLAENRFSISQTMRSLDTELPADQISEAKRGLARFTRQLPVLKTGTEFRNRWEYFDADREMLANIEEAYAQLIADAEADEPEPYVNRAAFLMGIYDFASAHRDLDAALAVEASGPLLRRRANALVELDDLEGAMADLREVESLSPNGSTYQMQIQLLALLGRADEALELAADYRGLGETERDEELLLANALGWAGSAEEGYALIEEQLALRPGDTSLFNALCWHASIFDIMNEARFEHCESAVEQGDYAPAVLDSRAFGYYRLGRYEEALADLDSVLTSTPSLTDSRLLRGAVRLAHDDPRGRADWELGLKMSPYLGRVYRAYGLEL